MNWNLRYATDKIPSKCVFCHGSSHYFKNSKDWTQEIAGQTGLPRPSVDTKLMQIDKPELDGESLHKRVPVPWAQEVFKGRGESLGSNDSRQREAIDKHLCPFCGEGFEPGETAQLWLGSGAGMADGFPMHPKCMRQTRIFCPSIRNEDDSSFETGPIEELRFKAENLNK
jgi:hypothetical protein